MASILHTGDKAAKRLSLDDILNGTDEFGLLNVQAKRLSRNVPLEVTNFEEISVFVDQHGRMPNAEGEFAEKLLARRLATYLKDRAKYDALRPYDRHNLLPKVNQQDDQSSHPNVLIVHSQEEAEQTLEPDETKSVAPPEEVTSLEDIFDSAAFNELDQGDQSIFDIQYVPEVKDRERPDEIAQRTVCDDFYQFEHIFRDLHKGLKSGEVKTIRFQQASNVSEGDAFIMEGVLCLIDEIGEYREDGEGRYNPRLRVIFENGTESNHLLLSLAKRLYMDETGRRIVRGADSIEDAFNNISHKDKRSGQIYFVTTLSENPTLKAIPNLIKIGYTELTVEERTRNAVRDTAFLEAPIKILAAMECYNLNPNKFETLIHGFLYAQRLNITLTGKDGRIYKPNEWFTVSLDTAREVVKKIIDGTIVNYRMDNTTNRLVEKKRS